MEEQSGSQKSMAVTAVKQIAVLKSLSNTTPVEAIALSTESPKHFEISEIAQMSGIKDERETQRYLYILEGQKLVSPFPPKDFTSTRWHITKEGLHAVKLISKPKLQ